MHLLTYHKPFNKSKLGELKIFESPIKYESLLTIYQEKGVFLATN